LVKYAVPYISGFESLKDSIAAISSSGADGRPLWLVD
jgi:hypothetical protein